MTEPIPSYVHLGLTCLLVRHEGQPMTCLKCDSRTHLATNYSAKRCYNCGCVDHFNDDCPKSSVCQGCGSPEHHLAQCDTSFFPDPSGTDDAESIPETPKETTMAFDISGSKAGSSATEDEQLQFLRSPHLILLVPWNPNRQKTCRMTRSKRALKRHPVNPKSHPASVHLKTRPASSKTPSQPRTGMIPFLFNRVLTLLLNFLLPFLLSQSPL